MPSSRRSIISSAGFSTRTSLPRRHFRPNAFRRSGACQQAPISRPFRPDQPRQSAGTTPRQGAGVPCVARPEHTSGTRQRNSRNPSTEAGKEGREKGEEKGKQALRQQAEHEALVDAAHPAGHGLGQPHVLQAAIDVQRIEDMLKGVSKAAHVLFPPGMRFRPGREELARTDTPDEIRLANVTPTCK